MSATAVWVSNTGEVFFLGGEVCNADNICVADKNLNTNLSNRDSALWRVFAAAQLGRGYQSRLSEMCVLVKGSRTDFGVVWSPAQFLPSAVRYQKCHPRRPAPLWGVDSEILQFKCKFAAV